MQGLHLTADLRGCDPQQPLMREADALADCCRDAVESSGLQPVAELFHVFSPAGSGITGVVLLAESHVAVHTWPELGAVTLDVYVCNRGADNRAKARALMDRLAAAFSPASREDHALQRGGDPAASAPSDR